MQIREDLAIKYQFCNQSLHANKIFLWQDKELCGHSVIQDAVNGKQKEFARARL